MNRAPRRATPGVSLRRSAGLVALALAACAAPAEREGPMEVRVSRAEAERPADAAASSSAASASAAGPNGRSVETEQIPGQPAAEPLPERYDLMPGDTLDIRFPADSKQDLTVQIRPDGRISLPQAGTFDAAGHTPDELEEALRARLDEMARPDAPRKYLIQPGDALDMKFPYARDFNEQILVRPDGRLQMQLIGAVEAAGRTPEELQKELQTRYARFLRRPQVAVIVRETTNNLVLVNGRMVRSDTGRIAPTIIVRSTVPRQIYVGGEVAKPGVLNYRPGLTLLQAVLEAGGRLPTAELSRVTLMRRGTGQPVVLQKDYRSILRADGASDALLRAVPADIALRPSDIVILPLSRAGSVSELLNEYVFKNVPLIRNSAFTYTSTYR